MLGELLQMSRYHNKMRCFTFFLLLVFLLPSYPADELPDLGDPAQATLTPQDERRISAAIMRDVYDSDEVLQDIEVQSYLQMLTNRLAVNSSNPHQKFNVFVLKNPTINAFAMPGGVIGVHTGLILAAENESELAAVLAHEISHVTQHHMARMMAQQRQNSWQSVAAILLALIAARNNASLAGGALQAMQAGIIQNSLNYQQDQEREADRIGIQTLGKSGLDVHGMATFFEKLMKSSRYYDAGSPAFLRTHPLTTERIADINNRINDVSYRQIEDSVDFYYVRSKVRVLTNAAQAETFRTALAQKQYASEAEQYYGLALVSIIKNKPLEAKAAIAWLLRQAKPHPMIDALVAQGKAQEGLPEQARAYYQQALQRFPMALGLIYGYADLLLVQHNPAAMIRFVESKQPQYPNDPQLFKLLALAYNQQQQPALEHYAQGEAYYRMYNVAAAAEQMEIAKRLGGGSFYTQSVIEARLKQMRQELKQADAR